ncbi:uncharacterized protein LOC134194244 isoform X2 [Corticium candelabrum]|uniref:uncharacterized protein LOC134194244 isoform X2 n=1 Tax=Corticium candelabrum TaxID=121492 RepID=UPI002E2703F3|nr:uncharacterized protein LOC134194244 isoform X2 [Corticium candelabrum]
MAERLDDGSGDEYDYGLRQWGYLNKKNCLDGGKRAKNSRWQTFWTELCGNTLRFFRDDSIIGQSTKKLPPRTLVESSTAKLKLAGFRTLNNLVVKLDYAHERDHVFELSLGDGSVLLFQAPSESSMLKWVAVLNDVSEAAGIESDGAIEDVTAIILKQLELENRRRRITGKKASQVSFYEDDAHDAVDFDAVNDPRLQCLYQQLRQREEVLKQLEEEEKAFLDEERSIMGPKEFARVHYIATASKKYYLIPGYQQSLIKPGTKLTIFGQLPNGRWRCRAEREGFADVYCDSDGQPGLTITISDDPNAEYSLLNEFNRLSIVSEPGICTGAPLFKKQPLCLTKSNSVPSFSSDVLKRASEITRRSVDSSKDLLNETTATPSVIIANASDGMDSVFDEALTTNMKLDTNADSKVMDSMSPEQQECDNRKATLTPQVSLTDEELIRKTTLSSKRLSAVDIGKMFSGLDVTLAQNDSTCGSGLASSPYDRLSMNASGSSGSDKIGNVRSDVQVLAMQGLFTVKEKKKEEPAIVTETTEVVSEESQLSIEQSVAEKSVQPVEQDDRRGYTATYTIYQSVTRKTFPLIGSVPTSLLWELQKAAESSSPPPSEDPESLSDLSPAPSPITSPLIQKSGRKQTGLKLFSSLKLGVDRHKQHLPSSFGSRSPSSLKRFFSRSPKVNRKSDMSSSLPLISWRGDRSSTLPPHVDTMIGTKESRSSSPAISRHSYAGNDRRSQTLSSVSSQYSDSSRYSWSPGTTRRSASPTIVRSDRRGSSKSHSLRRQNSDSTLDIESEERKSPLLIRRHTSEINRRGFEIRRKIRSKGISLIVGSSSSSSSEDEVSDDHSSNTHMMQSREKPLVDQFGIFKNQADRRTARPRAVHTMTRIDKERVMNFPVMQSIQEKREAIMASLQRQTTDTSADDAMVDDATRDEPLTPLSSDGSSTPTKKLRSFFGSLTSKMKDRKDKANLTKPRAQTLPREWTSSSRSPTPDVASPPPVVNPPMNSRRTVLLEESDGSYGFKLETYRWLSASGEQKRQTFVVGVDEDMPAYLNGLKVGDAFLEVNGESIENLDHSEVVGKLKAASGPIRVAVMFIDGVKRSRLQQQLNGLKKKLKQKQKELWVLFQREAILTGNVDSDEDESESEDVEGQ